MVMKNKIVQFRVTEGEFLDLKKAADLKHYDSVAAYLRALIRVDKKNVLGNGAAV
jgi:hypothetical protein